MRLLLDTRTLLWATGDISAEIEGLMLVSNERLFDEFGVRRLW